MAKTFKKNQPIVATLPTGRVVEGYYIEPFGTDGHSFYVNEYEGVSGGKQQFKKVTYGVKDEFINPISLSATSLSEKQYEAWVKRAKSLKERIGEYNKELDSLIKLTNSENNIVCKKLKRKIERAKSKLEAIELKINENKIYIKL